MVAGTSRDCRRLDAAEGVCVSGVVARLERGGATVEWATRRIDEAILLKEKLQSKVAVSTFLAGFFIAALVELVKEPEKLIPLEGGWVSYSRVVRHGEFHS